MPLYISEITHQEIMNLANDFSLADTRYIVPEKCYHNY